MKKNDQFSNSGSNLIQYPGKFFNDEYMQDSDQLLRYSLTIGEASSLMHQEGCKFASNRKVQRLCKDRVIDCFKLKTTRNGQPVSEWLVNETSLRTHIENNEIKWDGDIQPSPPATGNASPAPQISGNANRGHSNPNDAATQPNVMAMPNPDGNASGGREYKNGQVNPADDMASPDEDGAATDVKIGETRSLASLLIENARLTAEIEGTRDLIAEIRDDKEFLRDELKEARAGRKDVAAIAERMLETLETIAVGGRLGAPAARSEVYELRSSNAHQVSRDGYNPPSVDENFRI